MIRGCFAIALVALLAGGCAERSSGLSTSASSRSNDPAADGPLESNIVKVNKFFSSEPWLSFSGDGTRKIDGMKFNVYLEGPARAKGVFGTGTLVVTLFRLDRDNTGRERPTQVFEWKLPPDKAYPWRAKQESALGWGYGLRLQWGPNVRIEGRQVAVVVKYIREDGRAIFSSRKVLRVPSPDDGVLLPRGAELKSKPVRRATRA